jgi:hypothetical protein
MAEKKATKIANPSAKKAGGEAAVLAAGLEEIAAMPEPCRAMGERLHALILRSAPGAPAHHVVWHAGVREGRQDYLLFPRGQEIHDVRIHPGGEPHPRGGCAASVH